MRYRFQKTLQGVQLSAGQGFKMQKAVYQVNGTKDKYGATLSVTDLSSGLMYSIPLESIKDDLKKLIEE